MVIAVWFLIMYWAFKQIYKLLKPKLDNMSERTEKVDKLEKRVELLEKN